MNHLFFFFSITAMLCSAQIPCDASTFQTADLPYESVLNIAFDTALSAGGQPRTLRYDLYYPTGSEQTETPLIVLIHGGSFVIGSKEDMTSISENFAARGFAVLNTNYRLIDAVPQNEEEFLEFALLGALDVKHAIDHVLDEYQSSIGLQVEQISIGGISAGAILATQLYYCDPADTFSPRDSTVLANIGYFEEMQQGDPWFVNNTHPYRSLVGYSGGILSTQWMENQWNDPVFLVHETQDNVVPCGSSLIPNIGFPITLNGSCAIADAHPLEDVSHVFALRQEAGHVGYFNSTSSSEDVLQETALFLRDVLCPGLDINEFVLSELEVVYSVHGSTLQFEMKSNEIEATRYGLYSYLGERLDHGTIQNNTWELPTCSTPTFLHVQVRSRKGETRTLIKKIPAQLL